MSDLEVNKIIEQYNLNFRVNDSIMALPQQKIDFDPKYVSLVQNFIGNPNQLNKLISFAQSLIDIFYNRQQPQCVNHKLMVLGIKSKII